MKKENVIGLIIYLFIFAFAVVYGLTVLQPHYSNSAMTEVWQYAIYIVGCIVVGVLVTALLFELGHVVGAKVGGYKIVKFTMLYFSIYKAKDKWKIGFKSYDGLTGETIVIPNYEKKESPNPFPYLLYGPIFNLAWFVGAFVLFVYFKNGKPLDEDIAYAILTSGLISAILFIYDIIPAKLDTTTDGGRIAFIGKNKSRKAFNDLLIAEYNAKFSDSPIVIAEEDKKAEEKVPDTPEAKLLSVYPLIDEKKYDEAKAVLEEVLENEKELNHRQYLEARELQLYIMVLTTDKEEMTDYYNEKVSMALKKEISSDNTLLSIRTYILLAGLLEGSRSECLYALKGLNKAYKNTAPSRKHAEVELFNDALEKVCQAHPKWELNIYKLYE